MGARILASHHNLWQPLKVAAFFCLLILATRKRVYILSHTYLVVHIIFLQLIPYVFLYYAFVLPYRIYIISSTPKTSASVFVFKFACLSNIINVLLLLINPTNCAILKYGGMFTSICIWLGLASASIISTFFSLQSFRKISPISFFICPYTICRLYFGANTMWYSHLYVECAVLFISFFILLKPPVFYSDAVAKPSLF